MKKENLTILSFKTPELKDFAIVLKKDLYAVSVKVLNRSFQVGLGELR